MEITNINSFLQYYEKLRERTNNLIAVIPEDYIDWSYKPGKFTIADHIRHIASIERYMYGETVQGNHCSYTGCGRDLADGYQNVIHFFNTKHKESMEIFSQLNDLHQKCLTPGNVTISIWKWLMTMAEHEIHHRAQLYIYLNLLGIETPPMFGLSSEDVIKISNYKL